VRACVRQPHDGRMPRLSKREQEGDFQTSLLTNAQLPRYLEPTFSLSVGAVAPTNYAERDRVRNSFSSSACWGIRGLPQYLKAGAVNDSRRRKVVTNLSSLPLSALQPLVAPELAKEIDLEPASIQGLQTLTKGIFGDPTSSLGAKPPMKGTGTGAGLDRITFGKTPRYMGTMYGREKEVHRQQDEQQKMLAESFSRPSFSVSAKLFVHPAVGFVDPEFGPGFKPHWDALKRKVRPIFLHTHNNHHIKLTLSLANFAPHSPTHPPKKQNRTWTRPSWQGRSASVFRAGDCCP